jgi:PKD repeat protein
MRGDLASPGIGGIVGIEVHPTAHLVEKPMLKAPSALMAALGASAVVVVACQDGSQSPPERVDSPVEHEAPDGGILGPVDLVYVCGNRFLATNATKASVHVMYRVVGTSETGSLSLPVGRNDDEGYSETPLETSKRGVVELYQDDQRVARRWNLNLPCGPSGVSASAFAVGGPEATGEWTAPFPWPGVALHMSLMPSGKVLAWGHGTPELWDPVTGTFIEIPSPAWLFCAGHTLLGDGRLLVTGGHIEDGHGIPDITIFSASTESWSRSAQMRRGRWYPTATTLGNGDVVILAGRDQAGVVVAEPEVWSEGSVRVLSGASRNLPYYPRAFLAPNGKLFLAGPSQTTRYLDPAGSGSWTTVGDRLYVYRDFGAAVMYDAGKILYIGGGLTTNTAEIIDLNSPTPRWEWTGSMMFARRNLNATILPTGEVLVTGGSSSTTPKDITMAVRETELWNPTSGTWTVLASNAVRRTYHSTSILMPDGRVLHAGSGEGGGVPNEQNAELFSPPYLFRGPRPTISAAPSRVAYGTSFKVTTPNAAAITKVSLIRLGSVTHSFDTSQRFQWLSFARESGALSITLPMSRNRTPPGHYMLFILNQDGVPSVAKIVKVGSESEPDPPSNAPPVADFTVSCDGLSCNFGEGSTDSDGTVESWSWDFGDGVSSTVRNPTHTYATAGAYQVRLTVTDNGAATGDRTRAVTVPPPPNTAPVAGFSSNCSGLACGFTDGSTDAEGSVVSWAWDFGDGSSSTVRNPSHTYGAAGAYEVTLIATDDDGSTATVTHVVTVTAPAPPPAPSIVLNVKGWVDATKQYMALTWTGATGATVDVYRNGVFLRSETNDGKDTNSRNLPGASQYTYKVCQAGTAVCSNNATVVFGGGSPPPSSIQLSVRGWVDATKQYMALTWSGATGATVDVYRNGVFLRSETNDGRYTNSRNLPGSSQYTYKVCQAGTTICSNEATVTF